ncbi:MAG: hypothetical protein AB7F40_05265 [Victivallaceae bacterium]|nr:hypothetical protein [Victivallaceae bacterium]
MTRDYSVGHILGLKLAGVELGLKTPPEFSGCPSEVLQRLYNGLGPDRFPAWLRKLITKLLAMFEPPALVHDWEYVFMPKTYLAFTAANLRFAANCLLTALDAYGGCRMVREAACGLFLALLCQLFGWHGYKIATLPK